MTSKPQDPAGDGSAAATGPAPHEGGFVARLGGISLPEIVRLECLRGGQRILRVSSRGQSGYLYFRGGNLVHAATAITVGAAALSEMLAWRSGSVESGTGGWPAHESIPRPWLEVLLEVAGPDAVDPAWLTPTSAPRPPARQAPVRPSTVVLAPGGQLLAGSEVQGLPEAASYAAHMAELIGGFLGFDRFCALEVSYGPEQLLIGRGNDGKLLARRERDPAALDDLRREVLT